MSSLLIPSYSSHHRSIHSTLAFPPFSSPSHSSFRFLLNLFLRHIIILLPLLFLLYFPSPSSFFCSLALFFSSLLFFFINHIIFPSILLLFLFFLSPHRCSPHCTLPAFISPSHHCSPIILSLFLFHPNFSVILLFTCTFFSPFFYLFSILLSLHPFWSSSFPSFLLSIILLISLFRHCFLRHTIILLPLLFLSFLLLSPRRFSHFTLP